MSAARPGKDEIFNKAAELDSDSQREAYLAEVCADDPGLRREIDYLLERDRAAGSFLETSPTGLDATVVRPVTEKPGTRIGPYKLLERIGEGGMGVVYLAEQYEPVRRRVALKIIKPGMDTEQVINRFEAERQALAMMDHPNIAKVFDAGATDSGRPFFVMELVRGLPITQYCDEHQLTPRERLALFATVCQAVQHSHQKGIIHRDIKPSNVLVSTNDGRPVAMVIDFGLAKATGRQLVDKTVFTQHGQILGTVEYMSPEQADPNPVDVDTRTDIYSLGVMLYELLTGETPFDRNRLRSAAFNELLRIIREEDPPRPSVKLSSSEALSSIAANRHCEPRKLSALVRGELDWIVMKSLEKDRTRRYETANALAGDIIHYLNDEAVEACPPSPIYHFKKFCRRNKIAIGTAAAVTAALTIGIIGTTWQAIRAKDALAAMEISHGLERQQRIIANEAQQQAVDLAAQKSQLAADNYRLLYNSDMNRAQLDWENSNIASVLRLLDRHRPQSGREDLRSFEWYYLGAQCRRAVFTSELDVATRTFSLDYSQDGRLLATGGQDQTVRISGADRYQLLHELTGHTHWIHAVAFSPDGTVLASGDRKGALKLWDTKTGDMLRILDEHPGQVGALGFSTDGKTLASNWLKTVKLWDVASGQQLASLVGHDNYVGDVCFSPDGKVLASRAGGVLASSAVGQVKLWDLTTYTELDTLPGQLGAGGRIAYSPDGKNLVAGTRDGRIFLWNLGETELQQIIAGHTAPINAISFEPGGKVFATGSLDHSAKIWELATGKLLHTMKGHSGSIHALAFSSDSRILATASTDGTVKLWDLVEAVAPESIKAHRYGGAALAISPDGKRIASSGSEQDLRLWNATTGQLEATLEGQGGWIASLAFSPNGNTLASAGTDKTIKLWNCNTAELQAALTGHAAEATCVSFSPNGATLASSSADDSVILWDLDTYQPIRSINAPQTRILRFSSDGEKLATASFDQGCKLWSVPSGELLKTFVGQARRLYSLAISPDGRTIASGGENDIELWDTTSGSLLKTIPAHSARVSGLEYVPDGRTLISGSRDQTVQIWDLQTDESRITWRPELGRINQIALSADGKTLTAQTSGSGIIKIWRAAAEEDMQSLFREASPKTSNRPSQGEDSN